MTKEKKPVSKKVEKVYHIKVTVNGLVLEADTNSIHEALKELTMPDIIKTDVVFTATKEGRTAERSVNVFKGRRTFQNGTALQLMAIGLEKELG